MRLPDGDYELGEGACWIGIRTLAIRIKATDEGVSIAVYPNGHEMEDALAETWVLFSEGAWEEDEQKAPRVLPPIQHPPTASGLSLEPDDEGHCSNCGEPFIGGIEGKSHEWYCSTTCCHAVKDD